MITAVSREEAPRRLEDASCVVTGGAGFIGQHLVERLLRAGARVTVLDRPERNAQIHASGRALELHDVDLSTSDELSAHLRGCDYLFHLAAHKHNVARDAPERILQLNVLATERLLHAAGGCGVRKLVFSSSLYAHGGRHSVLCERDPAAPDTVYGISKLAGELLLRSYAREHGLASTSLRLFFVYGPSVTPGGAFPGHQDSRRSLIIQTFERILRGESPLIRGDGQQALDYLYVDDAVDALLCALQPRADGELFHIGSGYAPSVNELVRAMLDVAGSELMPEHVAADDTHATQRVADISHARELLGWQPATSLEEGLRRTLEWLRAAAHPSGSTPG